MYKLPEHTENGLPAEAVSTAIGTLTGKDRK